MTSENINFKNEAFAKFVQESIKKEAVYKKVPEEGAFVKATLTGVETGHYEPDFGPVIGTITLKFTVNDSGYQFEDKYFLNKGYKPNRFDEITQLLLQDANTDPSIIFDPNNWVGMVADGKFTVKSGYDRLQIISVDLNPDLQGSASNESEEDQPEAVSNIDAEEDSSNDHPTKLAEMIKNFPNQDKADDLDHEIDEALNDSKE